MASIGQELTLISNGDGNAVGSGQWFGGKALVFAWANTTFNTRIDVSPDGGTTWFQVLDVASGSLPTFSAPALMVRARGAGPGTPQGLNVKLVGYDEA